jgi:hypothetical protein
MSKSRIFTGLIAGAALTVAAALPVHAAGGCASVADADAFAMRDLQSRLMVAGLACGQRDAYNAFVTSHRAELADAGKRLKAYFVSRGDGVRGLDRHVTLVANTAAKTHGLERDAFCARTADLFLELQAVSSRSVFAVAPANALGGVTKPEVCTAAVETAPVEPVSDAATDIAVAQ